MLRMHVILGFKIKGAPPRYCMCQIVCLVDACVSKCHFCGIRDDLWLLSFTNS